MIRPPRISGGILNVDFWLMFNIYFEIGHSLIPNHYLYFIFIIFYYLFQ